MKFNIDRININSSLKYRMMFGAGGLVHACYLITFLQLRIFPLVAANVCSILIYLLGSIFSVNRQTKLMRYGWMVAFYTEIIIHATLCMLTIGADTDFYLYTLAIMPVSVYVLFLTCSIKVFIRSVVAFAVVNALSLFIGFYGEKKFGFLAFFPLTYDEIKSFRMFNVICAGVILLMFSLLFALEIHALLRRLEYTATHDALTGLLNRRSLRPLADTLADTQEHFCVALGDIDDFKKVNDTYGHDAGDTALKTVAEAIRNGISDDDIGCRWGGEEMLLVLRGSDEECLERLRTIWHNIADKEMQHEGGAFRVTITFGFVSCSETRDIEKLVSLADKRLYVGKTSGKNVIVSE